MLAPLTVSGGARLDHWQVSGGHLLERTIATGGIGRDDRFATRNGWLPTARGGIVAAVRGGWTLRAAAYLGWRMPTLNELFRPFRAGRDATAANPELKPEKLLGMEAGAQFRGGAVRFDVTGFINRLGNAIVNVTRGEGPGRFDGVGFVAAGGIFRQRWNVDGVNVRGIEASAEWSSGPWLLRMGASLTHASMDGGVLARPLNALRPAQTPNFAATLAGGWEQGGKAAQLVVRRIGAQYEDDLNTRVLHAATTFDAFASWPLTKRLQVVARGENITNKLVEAGINGDGSIERATPRTLWIGLRLR